VSSCLTGKERTPSSGTRPFTLKPEDQGTAITKRVFKNVHSYKMDFRLGTQHARQEEDTTTPLPFPQSLLGILVAPSSRIHSPFNMTFSTQCLTIAAKSSPLPGRFGNSSTRSRLLRTLSLICAVMLLSK